MAQEVIGQKDIKSRLLREAYEGRTPHALLLSGRAGCGKLALALTLARQLLCEHPNGNDACGECPSCKSVSRLTHPDLHFVFPVVRYKNAESSVSDVYLEAWRKRLLASPYFDLDDWLSDMKAENSQALIYAAEAARVERKLSLKSALGGRKVMIVWLPEKMNTECANKLLKLIEEPPAETHFLLVSNGPENLLPTILSRTQRIEVKSVETACIAQALKIHRPDADTESIARMAQGSYTAALKLCDAEKDTTVFFELFVMLMRLSYMRRIKDMKKWSEQVAAMGREQQKAFLFYCGQLIRENFVYNFRCRELNYMTRREDEFARNFARFVNERNVIKIMELISEAERDIEQNTNPKFVFFDFSLKMIVLLI